LQQLLLVEKQPISFVEVRSSAFTRAQKHCPVPCCCTQILSRSSQLI